LTNSANQNSPTWSADDAWCTGALVDAHALYSEALKKHPDCWHAAFQVAWLDTSFGKVTQNQLDALQQTGLSQNQLDVLAVLNEWAELVLAGQSRAILNGDLASWDIGALKTRCSHASEWEDAGKAAARAKQFGLAHACYAEAESLAPETYWDPPAAARRATQMMKQHMTNCG